MNDDERERKMFNAMIVAFVGVLLLLAVAYMLQAGVLDGFLS